MTQFGAATLTGKLLPERFSYVNTPSDAVSPLEIIDLAQLDFSKQAANPLEMQKNEIQNMVLSKARQLFHKVQPEAIKIVKLDDRNLPLSGIRNEAGFRVVNTDAIKRGDGMNGELVTVIFARTSSDREKIVPLVFAHADRDENGWKLKGSIDAYSKGIYGDYPDNLVRSSSYKSFKRFIELLNNVKGRAAVALAVVCVLTGASGGLTHCAREARRDQETKLVEYKKGIPVRVDFVKAQLASIATTKSPDVQAKLLNVINLDHYDALASSMEGSAGNKTELAETIKSLVHYELMLKRPDKYVNHELGEKNVNEGWGINTYSKDTRAKFLTDFLNGILKKDFSADVRAPLIKSLEEVSVYSRE